VTSRIEEMPEELHKHREQLEGRSILVKKAKVIPLEAIVRGYITGEQEHLNAPPRALGDAVYAVFL
jgi:phosphoribosylaminoimidazole-succinocarboxamide synthase